MKNFYSFLIIGLSILFLLSGCQISKEEQNIETQSMFRSRAIMRTALKGYPQSRVYFEYLGNTICLASAQPTSDSEKVIKDIKNIPATSKEKEIVDNLLSVWMNETNDPNKQLILRGICSGIYLSLYSVTGSSNK